MLNFSIPLLGATKKLRFGFIFVPISKSSSLTSQVGDGFVTTARGSCVAKQICEMPLPGAWCFFWGVPRDEWKGTLPVFLDCFGGGNWDTPVNIVHRECEFADAILHDANGNFEAPNEHSEVIFLAFDHPRNPPNKTYRFQDSTEVTEIFFQL